MATKLPTLPDMGDRAVQPPSNVLDDAYYLFLSQLLKVIADLAARTEMVTSAGAPAATDIPAGQSRVWKNTGAGTVRLYVNDGGTLKSVLLS
jgi:hypothetical protein